MSYSKSAPHYEALAWDGTNADTIRQTVTSWQQPGSYLSVSEPGDGTLVVDEGNYTFNLSQGDYIISGPMWVDTDRPGAQASLSSTDFANQYTANP